MTTTGLVLAAGSSTRLGRPKQLLAYRGGTLLGATLEVARRAPLDQVVVALGGPVDEIRWAVDLRDLDVVEVASSAGGCSASIVAALGAVDPGAEGVVLLLGDQPGVRPEVVGTLISAARGAAFGAVRYQDGRGHPLWIGREAFGELGALHGDKAVWKLLDEAGRSVVEVDEATPVPPDVDTWEDYEALVALDRANLGG